MATIRTLTGRTGTVYRAIIRRKGQTLSRTFPTKSDADRWALRKEADIDRGNAGLIRVADSKKLSDAVERFRLEILPTKAEGTQDAYSCHLLYWEQALGSRRLSDVTAQLIAAQRDALAAENIAKPSKPGKPPNPIKHRTPATVHRYLATLGSVLSAAVKDWHWLEVSPVPGVRKPKQAGGRTRFLSEAELHKLLQSCRESQSPELYLAVLLSVTTGARQAEIMGMRWENVDFKHSLIHVRKTKNGDARTLTVMPEALQLLKARREADGAVKLAGMVFPSRVSERRPVLLRNAWLSALKRAGIESFRWHDLRHSAASFLAMNGASLPEIGAVLGHRSAQTTKRYSHLAQEHTHQLVQATMGKLLGGKADE